MLILMLLLFLLLFQIYCRLLVISYRSAGKSMSQLEIKAFYSVTLSVTFSTSVAEGWPGGNRRFWYNPFLMVPNAAIISGTVFVPNFYWLLTSISRSLYLLRFSVTFCVNIGLYALSGLFASTVRSVITGTSYTVVTPSTFMTLPRIFLRSTSQYPVTP